MLLDQALTGIPKDLNAPETAHCSALDLLELAKEILDQVQPLVDLHINR